MNNFQSKFDQELNSCNNMSEVLACVQRHYDLDKPFGLATKMLVIQGVKKILKLIQAVSKKLNV
jgi:hypothetical protein